MKKSKLARTLGGFLVTAGLVLSPSASGVRYPKLLCGRCSLYSVRQAAIFRFASNKF
jgi:hypothetical protein